MKKIHTIITHKRPHLDEIVAILLLQLYGEKVFPGVSTAVFQFWDASQKTKDGRPWQAWQDEGNILIGVGGGRFDEHATLHVERKENECASTLVAKALRIHDEPWLQSLLKYTTNVDTKGGTNPFSIESLIRLANKTWFENDPESFMEWALQSVRLYLDDQIKFFTESKKEYDEGADTHEVYHNGRRINVVTIDSDDAGVAAYARSQGADVVVQTNSTGHLYITSQNRSRICFDEVIKLLRAKEMTLNKFHHKMHAMALSREGNTPGSEVWYYDKQAKRILNGGPSAPEVKPTKIPFETVAALGFAGLNEKTFHSQHYTNCRNGNCVGVQCPWFTAHLDRCKSNAA